MTQKLIAYEFLDTGRLTPTYDLFVGKNIVGASVVGDAICDPYVDEGFPEYEPIGEVEGADAKLWAERISSSVNALAGIPNEQIERDAKLYAHVAEMRERLSDIRENLLQEDFFTAKAIALAMSPELFAKLEESQ